MLGTKEKEAKQTAEKKETETKRKAPTLYKPGEKPADNSKKFSHGRTRIDTNKKCFFLSALIRVHPWLSFTPCASPPTYRRR